MPNILKNVRGACRRQDQAKSCSEVVELLYHWVSENVEQCVENPIPSISLNTMGIVNFVLPFVSLINGRPTFICLDYRRAGGYSSVGRKFAISMMHRQTRMVFPQFAAADLRVLQFVQRKNSDRRIVETSVDGLALFPTEQLDEMIAETFDVWQELHRESEGVKYKSA